MNCHEAMRTLAESRSNANNADLQHHLETCAACREIAGLALLPNVETPSAERVASIQAELGRNWRPVRLLPSFGAQTITLWGVYAALAVAVAAWLGLDGVHVMSAWQMLIYDGAFAAIAALAAVVVVQRLNPGVPARVSGTPTLWLGTAALAGLVLVVFPHFQVTRLFSAGVHCLERGCEVAFVAALLFAFVLRRTFASRPVAAGAAVGFLTGVCGGTALALHCPVLTVPHILVWHLPVLAIAAGTGALLAWLLNLARDQSFSRLRRNS